MERKFPSERERFERTDGANHCAIGNDVVLIKNLNQPLALILLASEKVCDPAAPPLTLNGNMELGKVAKELRESSEMRGIETRRKEG